MRDSFLKLVFGLLIGLAWSSEAEAQDGNSGTAGNPVWASVGRSYIDLPAVRKLNRLTPLVGNSRDFEQRFTDHDGEMDSGWRVDAGARLFGFSIDGTQGAVNIKGFYARFEDTQTAHCETTQDPNGGCHFVPLFDPGPTALNAIFIGEIPGVFADTRTSRDVDHWGAALEMASVGPMNGTAFAPRIGAAVKAIDQDIQLSYNDIINQTATYNEDLDTYYYGAYVGGETWVALGGGFSLGLDGEVGVYYARTDYDGTLNANGTVAGGTNKFTQTLSLDSDDIAVIGSLKAELKKTLGLADFALFAIADYYSYVPEIAYNEQEQVGVFHFGVGGNTRTTIRDDDAWSATVGGKVTLYLN